MLEASLDPYALVVVVAAMIVGSVAKAVTGVGLPLIAVSVMAPFLGVEQAVLIMAVPTFVTNGWLIFEFRRSWSGIRRLWPLLVVGAIGTVIGTVALTRIDAAIASLVLAAMVVSYLVLRMRRPSFELSERVTRVTAPVVGLAGGLLQGTTGAAGPAITTWAHSLRLPREAFVLTVTSIFQLFALIQIATFLAVGRYDGVAIAATGVALLPILAVFPLGLRLGRRLDHESFERFVLGLLALSAVSLLYEGVTGMV